MPVTMIHLYGAGFCLLLIISASLISLYRKSTRAKNLPPGPPTIPFLGNLHQVPKHWAFLKFTEWAKQYGGIFSLKLGPQTVMVVTDPKVIHELFEKRGAEYSNRPQSYIISELIVPNNVHILWIPYSPLWRTIRSIFHGHMGVHVVDHLEPFQSHEILRMMSNIVATPSDFIEKIRQFAIAVPLATVWGKTGATLSDPNVQLFFEAQTRFTSIMEYGATPPVDEFPFLKWLPEWAAPWKREAREIRAIHRKNWFGMLEQARARLGTDQETGALIEELLKPEAKEKFKISEEHIAYLAGGILEASTDLINSQTLVFILAMLKYPEIFKKVQEEVDGVCGDKVPTLDDRENMPYLRAVVWEVLRWRPAIPIDLPRIVLKDDYYDGYFLPKGSLILLLTGARNNDPNVHPNPSEFIPERFLDVKKTALDAHGQRVYTFGAGRRMCAGENYTKTTLFLAFALFAWTFNITAPIDPKTGKPIVDTDLETAFHGGFALCPNPFGAEFELRSKEKLETIERELRTKKPAVKKRD